MRDLYPDNYEMATTTLEKMDNLLTEIDSWKEDRFADVIEQFHRKFDDDMKTALIVRALENNGMKVGLPDNEVINAMFEIMEDISLLNYHFILNEDIRI